MQRANDNVVAGTTGWYSSADLGTLWRREDHPVVTAPLYCGDCV